MPVRLYVTGGIRFARAPRAVADAARILTRFDDVRHVVCEAVQRRACTVAELTEELEVGPPRSSALFREALAEVGDGVRSVAEADFRMLILRSGLPRPVFNAQLFDADGIFIATVDAWWQEAGVAAEIDSRAYHLAAADQDRTTERHDRPPPMGSSRCISRPDGSRPTRPASSASSSRRSTRAWPGRGSRSRRFRRPRKPAVVGAAQDPRAPGQAPGQEPAQPPHPAHDTLDASPGGS
jgi:hypothetical protein